MSLPVVPSGLGPRVQEIYQKGLALGNQPNVFTVVGDCDATPTWFLGDFDLGPRHYNLGKYTDLQGEIDYFQGSFSHQSLAVRRGFVAASVLAPFWADPKQCNKGETPLSCELRISHPSFAFVLLGTNDYNHREVFEENMRKILDALIEKGVVPILATKADNTEGDHSLNATIARLAYEYQLPLWNFWAAVQPLPKHGLDTDLTHLTWAANDFSDATRMQSAWPWRNLTALQTLRVVRGALKSQTISNATQPPKAGSPQATATLSATSTSQASEERPTAKYWREWPSVPQLSANALKIIHAAAHNPALDVHTLSRVGDCQLTSETFLTGYTTGVYIIPAGFEATVDYFHASFASDSITAANGLGINSVLNPMFAAAAGHHECDADETPLDCELRLRHPAVVVVAMGTNWKPHGEVSFEKYLRQVVERILESGALPVLATKADNIEGDWKLNEAIAQVAYDEDLPLVNTWRVVQALPNHGLEAPENIYLTGDGWMARNDVWLRTLDLIRAVLVQEGDG